MRAYHFLSLPHAVASLEKRHIKISRIEDLNDPFELLGIELPDKEARQAFIKTKKDIDARYGVICFSKSWINPVLWSHYADKHRGVCLGFDIPDDLIIHVKYNAKRLAQDVRGLATGVIDEKFMMRLLSTKYKDWAYEDEIRVFAPIEEKDADAGPYFKDFDDNLLLREVILGARCEDGAQHIGAILQNYRDIVTIIQARLAFRTFKIVENKQKTKKLPNPKIG